MQALVVATHGRHAAARSADGGVWQVFARGKKQDIAVGDSITLDPSAAGQAWIKAINPRRNLLYRSDAQRTKVFAANVDQVLLVLAPSPPLSPELVMRTWVAARAEGIPLLLLLNKCDLLAADDPLPARVRSLLPVSGDDLPPLLQTSVTQTPEGAHALLADCLHGKTTLVLGQSGMGKSSLINLMIPDAAAATNEISSALNSGRHTTTHTQLHALAEGGALIDSPGFQAFGLSHLKEATLDDVFSSMLQHREHCRFYNCRHVSEPGCGVLAARDRGQIRPEWLTFYQALRQESISARRAG